MVPLYHHCAHAAQRAHLATCSAARWLRARSLSCRAVADRGRRRRRLAQSRLALTIQQNSRADALLKAADAYGGVVSLERSNVATGLGNAPSRGVVLVKDSNVRGVLTVTALEQTSPLFAGGLRVGDRVVAVDGRPVADAASARAAAESVRAASVLRVERGSRKFDVDATTTPQAAAVARAATPSTSTES